MDGTDRNPPATNQADGIQQGPQNRQDNETNNEAAGIQNARLCIEQWCKRYKYWIALHCCYICIVIVGVTIAFIANKGQHDSQRPQPQYASFDLKTSGYSELDEKTILQWVRVENQNEGNIILVNGSYILIPQDGRYEIDGSMQMYIPPNTLAFHIILNLKEKKGKIQRRIKKSTKYLTIPEHLPIPFTFQHKLKAQDLICVEMNKARFISRDKDTSYLTITNLD
ncbi:uncharacterized protein LOC115224071 [Octopus sinensis]|uniref:Uncharacterized protein LOC115224071 n=1 Tax=Octopus sinensis TaxID=2607531 RepID=A0A6P7TMH5_9MOLL|nr:uncharacterized protein LOC115224071 [Octopus sinensis]